MQNVAVANSVNHAFNQTLALWRAKVLTTKSGVVDRVTSSMNLLSLAKDVESSQPNLAAEFRNFASRS
jgi:hypothetical protein